MARNILIFMPINLIVYAVSVAILVCGCSQDQDVEATYQKAIEYREAGELRAAIIELKNVLAQDPKNAEARIHLGELYLQMDNGPGAEKELRSAQELGKSGAELSLALVKSIIMQKRYEEAIALLDDTGVVSEDSDTLRGGAMLGMGRTEEASSLFEKVLNKNPDNPEARLGLIRIALSKKNLVEADKHLTVVLNSHPENIDALLMKGALKQIQSDNKQAQNAYEAALKINKDNLQARLGQIETLLAQGDADTAEKRMARLTELVPAGNIAVKSLQARLAIKRGDLPTAVNALSEVLAVVPDHSASLLMMGHAKYRQKNFEQAKTVLLRYVRIQPNNLSGRKLLATVQLELRQPDEVIQTLQPVMDKAGNDPQILILLANAYITKGEFDKASTYLEQAAVVAPDIPNIRIQLALNNLAAEVTPDTLLDLKTAVESSPDSTRAALSLITTYLKRREFDNALEAATKLSQQIPNDPVPYYLMALAKEGKEDLTGSRAQLEKALEVNPDYVPAALGLAELDLREGRTQEAHERYEAILVNNENHPQALVALARLTAGNGHTDEALKLVKQAQMHNPAAVEPRLVLAEYYLRMGKEKANEALRMAKEARSLAPQDPRVLLAYGKALVATGDNHAAVSTFQDLVERSPDSYEAYFLLALAQDQLGDRTKARMALDKSIELKPDNPVAQHALGNIELADRNTSAALVIARKLRELDPTSAAGYVLEGDALMIREDFDKAINAYQAALSHGAGNPVVIKLYKVMSQTDDNEEAGKTLRQWLARHPKDMTIRAILADAYRKQGQTQHAIKEFEQLREQQPNNIFILNNLAGLYQQIGDPKALSVAKQAYNLAPERAEILDTYGWLLVENGEASRGKALLGKAASKMPDNPSIRYHLAAALAETGDKQRAREELAVILESDTKFEERYKAESLLQNLQ